MPTDSLAAAKAALHPENFALANCIRALSIDAVEAARSGHPGAPMGMADAATVLLQPSEIRCVGTRLARPRPLRIVQRPCLDAALQPAASHRLRG